MQRKPAILYIVRHGETDWNKIHRVQGHTNNALNATGEEQARLAGRNLAHIHFDRVFSSDLLRAHRTAELIIAERKLAVKTSTALRERLYGTFEGKLGKELNAFYEELKQAAGEEEKNALRKRHGVETDDEVVSRYITFLREISVAHPGETILITSHGGVMRTFLEHLGYPTQTKDGDRMGFLNTGYIKLESDGTDFFIREINKFVPRDQILPKS